VDSAGGDGQSTQEAISNPDQQCAIIFTLRANSRLTNLIVFGLIALIYLVDLGGTPVYFGGDEAHFAVVGHSVATTGRNLNGDVMPLFFSLSDPTADLQPMPWGNTWYQPLLFYLVAAALTVAPMSEFVVRLPIAIVGGVVTPLLLYLVAFRLFKQRRLAIAAAVIFATMPPQVILSRQALDYICPLPFIVGWLWFLIDYTETRRLKSLLIGGLCLGFGFYSYIASWVMMPIYLALSGLVVWRVDGRLARPMLASVAGFTIPLLVLIPWLWTHPEMLRETFDRYQMSDQQQVSLIQEPENALRLDKLAATVSTYWSYFDPAFLFMIGGPSLTTSTGRVGVFLLPLAILLPLGVFTLIRRRDPSGLHALILLAVVAAPVAATLKGQPFMTQRVMFMLPFSALVAAYGVEYLLTAHRRIARALATAILVLGALQFAAFYRDYYTHYKLRSAFYYDPSAVEDVAAYLMADTKAPVVFLSVELDDIGAKWRYYTTRDGRSELLARTRFVLNDGLDIGPGDAGSLLAIHVKAEQLSALENGKRWAVETIVNDVDNRPTVAILRKLQ
jgi:4-amino-4-deoxy-L-arabinose transferase-like glycosyltransferase